MWNKKGILRLLLNFNTGSNGADPSNAILNYFADGQAFECFASFEMFKKWYMIKGEVGLIRMKVLVVYDTVSPMRVTGKVAETIIEVLKEMGIEVDSLFVKDANVPIVKNYDCLIAGAPTMIFRVSSNMRHFLETLSKEGVSGKLAAAFDTQVQWRFSGSAVKGIEAKLKDLNFKVITAPLIAYVEGGKDKWHFKEGELEKAKKWAKTVAEALQLRSSQI